MYHSIIKRKNRSRALPLSSLSGTVGRRTQTRHPHNQPVPTYRCFFPDLTEFVVGTIMRPDHQHPSEPHCCPWKYRLIWSIRPRISGFRVIPKGFQGTASSPSSTTGAIFSGNLFFRKEIPSAVFRRSRSPFSRVRSDTSQYS